MLIGFILFCFIFFSRLKLHLFCSLCWLLIGSFSVFLLSSFLNLFSPLLLSPLCKFKFYINFFILKFFDSTMVYPLNFLFCLFIQVLHDVATCDTFTNPSFKFFGYSRINE